MSEATAIFRQYRLERRMFWRNPSAAFFALALPLLFLGLFGAVFSSSQKDLDIIIPGIAGMAIMATTFSTLTMQMVFLRENGILKRMRGLPLSTGAYIGGILGSAAVNACVQLAIVVVAGDVLFGTGWPKDWVELLVYLVAGVACMAALGIAWSHVIPNYDSAAAYSNIIFLPMIFISGVFYDVDNAPTFLRDIAQVLPLTHIIDGLSGALVTGAGLSSNLNGLAIVLLWTAFAVLFAIRGFSWEQKRA